jgi:crossover junction endodeoxyribonuclease RuvC
VNRYFIGIDPGLQGAIALIYEDGRFADIADTPTLIVKKGKGKKHFYNISEAVKLLRAFSTCILNMNCHAVIENVHAMPKQGVTSMFSMGVGFGMWQGILTALEIPVTYIEPRNWKKIVGITTGADKSQSCVIAGRLFPTANLLRSARSKKPSDGRADALLIAEAVRRTLMLSHQC